MGNPTQGCNPEEIDGQEGGWIGQSVEEGSKDEWNNIFQVIPMGPVR